MHYAGVGCEMDAAGGLASRHGLPLIEDNAHGLFGRYRGRALGSFGATSTLSFHETKNLTCGEGGALVINDPPLVERAEILREKGTNRSRFFRGQVDKYTWVDVGSSYLPSDILAAYLCAQLESRDAIQARAARDLEPLRRRAGRLGRRSTASAGRTCRRTASTRPTCTTCCCRRWTPARRSSRICGRGRSWRCSTICRCTCPSRGSGSAAAPGQCPVTEDVSDRLVRLPLHYHLSAADQDRVIDAVTSFRP